MVTEKTNMNPQVDLILAEGCGRCKWHGTPQCKVHKWEKELAMLRDILLNTGLQEEVKWGQPCYTDNGRNILILAPFKEYCALNFFNGALIEDSEQLLTQPGEHTQSGRQMRFTDVGQITKNLAHVQSYIFQAIEAERAGVKFVPKANKEIEHPQELLDIFAELPEVEKAFNALTPGKKRAYLMHFTQPKQSATKTSRIQKAIPDILNGKGIGEDYRSKQK